MNIKLPSIICSGMVIEKRARIWGFCDGCGVVEVCFRGKAYTAEVSDGKWEVFVLSDDFGGPFEMTVGDIVLTDVYVGYVFMLCGQSNMETPAGRVRIRYGDDFEGLAHNPRIRAFRVETDYEFGGPRDDCKGYWRAVGPDTVNDFYAVSFYLSRRLAPSLDAPIGLIECAVGGTRIESWMRESDAGFLGYTAELMRLCRHEGFAERITSEDEARVSAWHNAALSNDCGLMDNYFADDFDCGGWAVRGLTKSWAYDIGVFHGVVWFIKSFDVPDEIAGLPGRLFLGTIIDSDTVYLNGSLVGSTGYRYPPRVYPVPEGLVRRGRNTVVIRVVCERGLGGFTADKDYLLETAAGCVSLDGDWSYKATYAAKELMPATRFVNYPSVLYNAMLAPVFPFSVSAFLWYQGESNSESPYGYDEWLAKFLRQVRSNYGEGLPFLAVQLPNYDAGALNGNWQLIRDQQASILNYPNTALIVTLDIGEDNDLHPLNKRDLSERLATGVLHLLRGDAVDDENVLVSG